MRYRGTADGWKKHFGQAEDWTKQEAEVREEEPEYEVRKCIYCSMC